MTNKNIIIGLITLTLTGCQSSQNKQRVTDENSITEHKIQLVENSEEHIEGLRPFFNSIINKIPKLELTARFELKKGDDNNLNDNYLKLDKSQVDLFFATDDLQNFHSFYHFYSYFYGYNYKPNGLTKLFIISTNWQTTISLDCFLINTDEEVLGYFNTSFLELENNYAIYSSGQFLNDTTYSSTIKSYDTIVDNDELEVRTTKIQTFSITELGNIIKKIEKQETDTLFRSN